MVGWSQHCSLAFLLLRPISVQLPSPRTHKDLLCPSYLNLIVLLHRGNSSFNPVALPSDLLGFWREDFQVLLFSPLETEHVLYI